MGESSSDGYAAPLSPEARQRGQTALIRAALMSIVLHTVTASVNTLFLLCLGAAPIHIGVLGTLTGLTACGSLLGLRLLPHLGKTGLGALARLLDLVPLGALVVLAILGLRGVAAVWAAIAALVLLSLIHTIGNTGWWPLLQDNTAGDAVGAFLARMRTRLRAVEVGLPIFIGAILGSQPEVWRFALPYVMCMVALAFGAWFLRQVPERATPPAAESLLGQFAAAWRVPSVRRYTAFVCVRDFTITLAWSFWVVLLKARGLPDNQVVWLTVVAAVGNVLFLRGWGRLADRHGSRPVLSFTLIAEAIIGLAWLLLPDEAGDVMWWALGYYFLWGFLQGGFLMGRTHAMIRAVPVACQACGFVLIDLASSAAAAVAALLAGGIFQWLTSHEVRWQGLDGRTLYFAAVQMSFLGVWLVSRRLSGYEQQTPTRQLMNLVWRRVMGKRDAA